MGAPPVLFVVVTTVLAAAVALSFVIPARRRARLAREARERARRTSPPPPEQVSASVRMNDPGHAYPLDEIDLWGHWHAIMELRQAGYRRSIEQVAADLRRIHAILPYDENASAVHQFAHRIAYDQLLIEACTMLGIPHGLGDDLIGPDRELERMRAEASLEYAGLVLTRPSQRTP